MSRVYAVPYEGPLVEGELNSKGFVHGWHLDDDYVIIETQLHRSQYLFVCDDFNLAIERIMERDGEGIRYSA